MKKLTPVLYIEVENLGQVERALRGADIVHPRRTALYGVTEIFVRDPLTALW